MQETNEGWEDFIRTRLGHLYPFMAFSHSENWCAGGSAVLSKWPLDESDCLWLPAVSGWFDGMTGSACPVGM